MGRFAQQPATKGSQRWIQYFVNEAPEALNNAIGLGPIRWASPLAADEFAEYRDQTFLDRMGVMLSERPLSSFWPIGGPQWDAFGTTRDGVRILVEGKAHIPELFSAPTGATEKSLDLIQKSLEETKSALNARPGLDWSLRFYQYANRLAHAHLFHNMNDVRTVLVFLYFVGDADMNGPTTSAEWKAAIEVMHEALGIRGKVPDYVRDVFLTVPVV